jgi:hypothetical protein
MTLIFAIFLCVHGLIHLLGVVKAFRIAELPQLTQPVSPFAGLLWLAAALLFLAASVSLLIGSRWWWAIGAGAIVISMLVIASSWTDAKYGALANLVALTGIAFGFLAHGPVSLRAEYERDVDRALARFATPPVVSEADLGRLPEPVRRYLRAAGVVGRPRVRNFRVRMHGRIRNRPDGRWMPLTAEQHNFVDEPARLFYLNASMLMVPVQGYHRYVGPSATMRVKAAAAVRVLDVAGKEMNEGETVTMFNDMCIMAPATLLEPTVTWEPVDALTSRARFTNGGHTVRAELSFNASGELTDFSSDDRYQTSPDGRTSRKVRWSTPLGPYRSFGDARLASGGEARWHEPGGEYAYIELTLDEIEYNVRTR